MAGILEPWDEPKRFVFKESQHHRTNETIAGKLKKPGTGPPRYHKPLDESGKYGGHKIHVEKADDETMRSAINSMTNAVNQKMINREAQGHVAGMGMDATHNEPPDAGSSPAKKPPPKPKPSTDPMRRKPGESDGAFRRRSSGQHLSGGADPRDPNYPAGNPSDPRGITRAPAPKAPPKMKAPPMPAPPRPKPPPKIPSVGPTTKLPRPPIPALKKKLPPPVRRTGLSTYNKQVP